MHDQAGALQPADDVHGQVERLVMLGRTWRLLVCTGDCWGDTLLCAGGHRLLSNPGKTRCGEERDNSYPQHSETVTRERAPMVEEALVTLGLGKKTSVGRGPGGLHTGAGCSCVIGLCHEHQERNTHFSRLAHHPDG